MGRLEEKLKVMLDGGAYLPVKAHRADAGYDIRTPKSFTVRARNSFSIDTGVHMLIPEGYVGFLKSKSGLNVKHGIQGEGVIDAGYVGSIVVKLYNNSDEDYHFHQGDKISQIVVLPVLDFEMKVVEEFVETERGDNGFGSSGR